MTESVSRNFWIKLDKPVFTLAPMEDVTDTVFREIVLGVSDPGCLHVLYSEFTSTDGLCHEAGGPKVRHRLRINPTERELLKTNGVKIVAQIWGTDPEKFSKAARIISDSGLFDGIDINMGCPVKKIFKQGACAALISQPDLSKEIILATKEATDLPVSIKTRIGINRVVTEEWIGQLLETSPALITVHGRIQKQQSTGMADWNEVGKAVKLRNIAGSSTLIHGNGDVISFEDGLQKVKEFGVEGIMVGRGIFHSPWFFNHNLIEKTPEEKLALLWKHTLLFSETWKNEKNFAVMKRFFKIYASGFNGASNIRVKLMDTGSVADVEKVLKDSGIQFEL
jgi:tRNA-dihydrouridine synthase